MDFLGVTETSDPYCEVSPSKVASQHLGAGQVWWSRLRPCLVSRILTIHSSAEVVVELEYYFGGQVLHEWYELDYFLELWEPARADFLCDAVAWESLRTSQSVTASLTTDGLVELGDGSRIEWEVLLASRAPVELSQYQRLGEAF